MNYFATEKAARHYRDGRPDFHAASIARVADFLQLNAPLERALDIACGTGLSTKALLQIAVRIDGSDSSTEMLQVAFQDARISYSRASAERQPFDDAVFDLITISSGVHWFDIDSCLAECRRLLKPAGWLVLYDNFFLGECRDSPHFKDWHRQVQLQKFPAPPRIDDYDWSREHLATRGFDLVNETHFRNEVLFDRDGIVRYFISQSNIIDAVERGQTTYDEAAAWLRSELQPFFAGNNDKRAFAYGNWIKILKPVPITQ